MDRNFIWEADYGVRIGVFDVTKQLLRRQNAKSLQCISYFVNNNPYNLEFFILASYDSPTENEILYIVNEFDTMGLKYRNDITMDALFIEMSNRRFDSRSFCDEQSFDMLLMNLFWFGERTKLEELGYIMKPFSRDKEIFISHASENKSKVRKLIPYLNGKNHSVWFDEYNIEVGSSIYNQIKSGLEDSYVIFFWVTNDFIKSDWCKEEMRVSKEKNLKVIYLVEDNIEMEHLPQEIRSHKYISISEEESIDSIANKIFCVIN